MKDLIERQAAIDALVKLTNCNGVRELFEYVQEHHLSDMWSGGIVDAIDAVIAVPAAEPEPKWIPCSERLPAVHESGNSFSGIYMQSYPVLVYGVSEYDDKYRFHIATYCDDLNGNTYWSTEVDAETVNGVTAWMPLPETYKERREE